MPSLPDSAADTRTRDQPPATDRPTHPPTAAEPPTLPPATAGENGTASEAVTLAPGEGTYPEANGVPAVPGYEILDELGRGGMGVVYLARQRGLKRLVALKMILAGAHAGEHVLARFRTEAEAVARLQHPNIVQIYEVGELPGGGEGAARLPFFSLEYVDGGSLADRLREAPPPPAEAACLIETLAEAMQAAHRCGIIHRDLKPANVLLQRKSQAPNPKSQEAHRGGDLDHGLSPFEPKITDFGLAKQLGQEQGQTQSGAVMGTPSYMAPEQAGGKTKEIGPAVDIYSLGAILYELLTGRPPFKAATSLDTVLEVVNKEPVPPSRLNVLLPRDLETICLKCLQKEPARRYASAAELAEDLRRFRTGEPILARPVGRAERLLRWCRRNPAVAALVVLSVLSVGLLAALLGGIGRHPADPEPVVLPETPPVTQPSVTPAPVPAPLRIVSLRASQHRGERASLVGDLGSTSSAARFDDDVRVHAELSDPGHCYLIAFNPDGKEQLCYPSQATAVPPAAAEVDYPASKSRYFSLTDGVGLQAFVLLASRKPLPSYQEWRALAGAPPWQSVKAEGVWRFDGHQLDLIGLQRGQERPREAPPKPLEALCAFFKERAHVDAVQILAFAVEPKEGAKRLPNPDEEK
jgi:serine/threonine protein kinase